MILMKFIFLLLLFGLSHSVSIFNAEKAKASPIWSSVYTVTGVLTTPFTDVMEPFNAWYDSESGRSRIDYYEGMVKTFQFSKNAVGEFGTSIKLAPITTEEQHNVETCLQVNGTQQSSVDIQSVLPDLTNFKLIGSEIINGEKTKKWYYAKKIGEKINKFTMWIKYKRFNDMKAKLPVPVRYQMLGFNSGIGFHYDDYILEYDEYNVDDIPEQIFSLNNMTCMGFPGPGVTHIYTLNPMREFIYPVTTEHVDQEFDRFINKHHKKYDNSLEYTKRKDIFRHNIRYIQSFNRAHHGYSLSVNHLADRYDSEIRDLRGRRYTTPNNGAKPFPYDQILLRKIKNKIPQEYDWRIYGAVTPVKDQSVCGSCWAFGVTGAVEGAYFLHNGGYLTPLSQQALLDCSWGSIGNLGCEGGEDFRAYQWIMKYGGIPLEEEYGGYLGHDYYCHADNVTFVAPIKGFVNVTTNNPYALKLAIFKHGPVSVAIDASHKSFSFYSHGVYYEPKCKKRLDKLDHIVLAVGYGTVGGQDYWLIKNSWSKNWGNDGYILMSAKGNNCGVETIPTYVEM